MAEHGTSPSRPLEGRTLILLTGEDFSLLTHRKALALAAKGVGARVIVAARATGREAEIRALGLEFVALDLKRAGKNPLKDLGAIRALIALYRREKPDIVHHVAMKPVLYGSIAAWVAGVPGVVNAITGLGYLFISRSLYARMARALVGLAFRVLLNRRNTVTILQNEDDLGTFIRRMGVRRERMTLIRGAGVDVSHLHPPPSRPEGPVVAVCLSRLLWDKGIGELVEAARLLKARGLPLVVRLVGPSDLNPAAVPPEVLEAWRAEGVVEIHPPVRDPAEAYRDAHIAVLPSYREGLPKALLEAAACGLPLVASDVPGCREICRHDRTGLLVPARAAQPLADALERLARDPALREKLGAAARLAAETEFADTVINAQTLELYARVVPARES